MIDQLVVQKIIDTANIVEVVQDIVPLKRAGSNYKGNCPFHNEKTPSFVVSPAKGIFKCFGCGESGTAISFIMKHEQFSFVDTIKYLGQKYNITVEEKEESNEQKEQRKERDSLIIVSNYAQKYFSETLQNDPKGRAIGRAYFIERGYSDEIISKFQLGYCPEKYASFTNSALKKGYKLEFLEKTGLTIVSNDRKFDRFNGRVMFPIHSLLGKTIGFGGRTLKADKKTAKYLNSPESEIYHKSKILYGIYYAKSDIVKKDKCYLVEGYTDVISMSAAGVENVVASSGTSLTEAQISLIRRFTPNLTFIFDGDKAGIKAALRGIDLVLKQDMNVRVVPLPEDEDPDSFSKKLSKTDLENYIAENEVDFISFKSKLLLKETENDPINRARVITDIVNSIAIIPSAIKRSVFIRETSKILEIEEESIYEQINNILQKKSTKFEYKKKSFNEGKTKTPKIPAFVDKITSKPEEKSIIYYLLNFGSEILEELEQEDGSFVKQTVADYIITEIQNDDLEFQNLIYEQLFKLYKDSILESPEIDIVNFINHPDPEISEISAELLGISHVPSKIWGRSGSKIKMPEMTFKDDIPKVMVTFKFKIIIIAIANNNNRMKSMSLQVEDFEAIENIMKQNKILTQIKVELAKLSGARVVW